MSTRPKVLCFGDSNTWGYGPGGLRYDYNVRWPGVLDVLLEGKVKIVEDGVKGRTSIFDDPDGPNRNGIRCLERLIELEPKLQCVLIMLGLNDLKSQFRTPELSAQTVALRLESLVGVVRSKSQCSPQIVLMASPVLEELSGKVADGLTGAHGISRGLATEIEHVAKICNTAFLDVSPFTAGKLWDGAHLDEAGHRAVAQVVAALLASLLL